MDYQELDSPPPVGEEIADEARELLAPPGRRDRYWLHILLFLLTFATTTLAGVEFVSTKPIESFGDLVASFHLGVPFSVLLLLFLSAHEFGHYFAARWHRVDATLPYYIPMPFFMFGTMGAVIRTRSVVPSRKIMFDIGVAGPLAGFVVALSYLVIGMATMPGIESLYAVHPEYRGMAHLPDYGLHYGGFLLFTLLKGMIVAPGKFFPPMNEIYHYPLLNVGWFGMFVTALNMIPVGQLDGGHVIYGMFGRHQPAISRWFVRFMIFAGLGGVGGMLLDATRSYNPDRLYQFLTTVFGPPMEWIAHNAGWWLHGWPGWLLWVVIIKVFIKVPHPPVPDETPLDAKRMAVGWVALAILVLTFCFSGMYELGA
jgi:membrane-associated protease RseP (regulator of RpoE activity)